MTIRTKLLLFIPLLVLLTNSVTFFLFENGKAVQQSYDTRMDRFLLYKQSSQKAENMLKALYNYLLSPDENSHAELNAMQSELLALRAALAGQENAAVNPSVLAGYANLIGTLLEQAGASLSKADSHESREALNHYEDAEKTTGFIRDESQHLVDLELSSYQSAYQDIHDAQQRMYWLGAAVFVVNTLLSVVLAVWISRSITWPVNRLVQTARHISRGDLHTDAGLPSGDELGLLSDTFRQMIGDLRELMAKEKESLEKDRLMKELELQALQSQINPHFLFNTLNSISKLALIEGAEQTSDLIVSMSNLLRYNLRKLDEPATLRDELAHVREYIRIQQTRFRDRVRFETEVDEAVLNEPIPLLTIQPLVENAFVHGIEKMERGAVIRLSIRGEADAVAIEVADNGSGMSEETRRSMLQLEAGAGTKDSAGIGTRNVFKRLQLFYGSGDWVHIQSEPGKGTTVSVRIPYRKEGDRTHVPDVDRG